MNKRSSNIFLLWVSSTALIVAAVITSTAAGSEYQKYSQAITDSFTQESEGFLSQTQIQSQILGRQVIAKIYGDPTLTQGIVLGDQITLKLDQEEISDINTPAVVKIVNHVEGQVSFEEFDIDFFANQLIPNGSIYTETLSATSTGTGFYVDSNGHIITNSHVIDKSLILQKFTIEALFYYGGVIEQQLDNMSFEEQEALKNVFITRYGSDPFLAALALAEDIAYQIETYISNTAIVDYDQMLGILNSDNFPERIETEADLNQLKASTTELSIVDWNPDYLESQKDVALVKSNTPSSVFLNLNSKMASTGEQIYVIGFPANAEVSAKQSLEKSVTQGNINSIKTLDGIELYQIDARASAGSSGSPLLNEDGEVIGIVTFLIDGIVGDGFTFAVPISHARDLMTKNGVTPGENEYLDSFTAGLTLAQQDLCRKANAEFGNAQSLEQPGTDSNLQKYIDDCDEVIAAGNSKDGRLYELQEMLGNAQNYYLWAAAGALLLISAGAAFLLLRKNKAETISGTIQPVAV